MIKLNTNQNKNNQHEESIELKSDSSLLKTSIYNPHSTTFTLYNPKLMQKSFEPLNRRTSHQSIESFKLNSSVEEPRKGRSFDLGYSSNNIFSRVSSRSSSISQSSKALDQKLEKIYPILAIKEQIDSEETDTKRSINPFLETDRLTEVDLQTRSSVGRNSISEQPELKSDYKFLQQSRKTEPTLSVGTDALDSSLILDDASKSKGDEGVRSRKKIKYTIRQFSKNRIIEAVLTDSNQNCRKTNEPLNETTLDEKFKHRNSLDASKNYNKRPVDSKTTTNSRKIIKPITNENSFLEKKPRSTDKFSPAPVSTKKTAGPNYLTKGLKNVKAKATTSNKRMTILTSSLSEDEQSHLQPHGNLPSIDVSADSSVVMDEGYSEDYRQVLTKSLNFIRDKRVEFSTLCVRILKLFVLLTLFIRPLVSEKIGETS